MSNDFVDFSPVANPDTCVILMHGLGANGHDLVPLVPMLNLPSDAKVRFIFPNAPTREVTINGGMEMPAWFDIASLNRNQQPDEEGLTASSKMLIHHIQQQIDAGINPKRIIIGGFSQGGVVALHTAIRSKHKLGGVICLSGYLLLEDKCEKEQTKNSLAIPVFLGHGDHDELVKASYSDETNQALKKYGYNTTYKTYDVGHSISQEEAADVGAWLKTIIQK